MEFFVVLGIIFGVFALSFAMINIRYIFKKEEFRGTCASANPALKDELGECSSCGGDNCKNKDKKGLRRIVVKSLNI